jgi:hypothetical protein
MLHVFKTTGNKLSQLHEGGGSILKFPYSKRIAMDSCEVIYLSKPPQRAVEQGKQPPRSGMLAGTVLRQVPEAGDAKVVDLRAWAAAHRPD